MLDTLLEALLDVAKTLPILVLVYTLLYYIENRLTNTPALLSRAAQFGPIVGALTGTVPQCGFSAAAAALFSSGYLAPATLVAVFLATSDEAVPVLLAGGAGARTVAVLLLCKLAIAIVGGYALRCTFFRNYTPTRATPDLKAPTDCACCSGHTPMRAVLWRTAKTALFLFVVLVVLGISIELIGEERLASLLLSGSAWQPLLCALLGLIPSCAMSVLFSELFVSGTIGFGALVAGLSTGAGFGYLVLLGNREGRARALPVIAATFAVATLSGTLLHLLGV